jgi:hypothetical protein
MFGIFKSMRAGLSRSAHATPRKALDSLDVWRTAGADGTQLTDALLQARLAETVAWCDSLTSQAELRSRPLAPSLFHDGPDDLVCCLGRRRQLEMRHKGLLASASSPVTAAGRFMLYFPEENLADGFAEVVSNGFFDADNVPACDTWVSMVSDEGHPRQSGLQQLLCYVPESLTAVADAGVDGNAEQCIVWLDTTTFPIRGRVEALTSGAMARAVR